MEATYSKLPSPVQRLNLVDPVSDTVEQLVKAIFLGHLLGGVEDEVGVWSDVVLNLGRGGEVRRKR